MRGLCLAVPVAAQDQTPPAGPAAATTAPTHVLVAPMELKWGAAPPVLPKGPRQLSAPGATHARWGGSGHTSSCRGQIRENTGGVGRGNSLYS